MLYKASVPKNESRKKNIYHRDLGGKWTWGKGTARANPQQTCLWIPEPCPPWDPCIPRTKVPLRVFPPNLLFSSSFHISYGGLRGLSCEKVCFFLEQITRQQQRQKSVVCPYGEYLIRRKALWTCSDRYYTSSLFLLTKPVWEPSRGGCWLQHTSPPGIRLSLPTPFHTSGALPNWSEKP